MHATKEIAKFAAGAAAWEAIGHAFLALSGLLTLTAWGVTLTAGANAIWVVVIAAVSIALAWYAWGTGEAAAPTSHVGGAVSNRSRPGE